MSNYDILLFSLSNISSKGADERISFNEKIEVDFCEIE